MSEKNISWNELDESTSSKYIRFPTNDAVNVIFSNWRLYKCEHPIRRDGSMTTRFTADIVNQDGTPNGKVLDTLSTRLILGLREHIESLDNSSIVQCRIMKLGEGMNTNYKVFDFKVMDEKGNEIEDDVEVVQVDKK